MITTETPAFQPDTSANEHHNHIPQILLAWLASFPTTDRLQLRSSQLQHWLRWYRV